MKMRRLLSSILALVTVMGLVMASASVTAAEISPYKDVKPSRWSYEDIMYVSEKGLMTGTSADKFAPAETMTRAMVVTVLYRLQGEPDVDYKAIFTDVKEGKWYTDAVIWASEKGIVEGKGNGIFAPTETITREQLAAIIRRYAPLEYIITEETKDITGYADYKKVHDYARESLAWANAIGLITGKTETTLAPREGATREQFAAILKRFKEYDSYKYELVYNEPKYGQNYAEDEYELVTDADIYVSVDGNDANPGTLDKPVKTFAKAKEMVRELKNTATDGITVAFKAGNYGNLENLEFELADSGKSTCPITYCAYGDGDVVFENGIMIAEESFVPITDAEAAMFPDAEVGHIYKTDLTGKLDNMTIDHVLFSETSLCDIARFPNKQADGNDRYYIDFTTRVEENGKAEHEYDKLSVAGPLPTVMGKFSTFEGMYITGYLRSGWFQDTFPIKEYDAENRILALDFENYDFDGVYDLHSYPLAYEDRMDDKIYFRNIPEFLDTAGEYWVDNDTHTLYVYDPVGDYAIPTGGMFMYISYGVSHLNFIGLDFITTLDTAVGSVGWNITFDRCTFGNVAGQSCISATCSTDYVISDCEFYNFVCGGIHLEPYYYDDVRTFNLEPSGNKIVNNYFHDFGLPQYFENADAIGIMYDVGAYIANNEFVNGVHGAIRYDSCIDMVIEYNVFDNLMVSTYDFGAIYTYASEIFRDNVIRYNLFMNMNEDEAKHSIYFDGAYGQIVYGNLFYNTGDVFFNEGRDHMVYDNISISPDSKRNFILAIDRLYRYVKNGKVISREWLSEFNGAISCLAYKPAEGEAGYEKWVERWPILYNYTFDVDDYGKYECLYTTVNTVKNNTLIASKLLGGSVIEDTLIVEDNRLIELDENPYFADPTHGDYTIVKGADDFEYQFDMSKVGRQ